MGIFNNLVHLIFGVHGVGLVHFPRCRVHGLNRFVIVFWDIAVYLTHGHLLYMFQRQLAALPVDQTMIQGTLRLDEFLHCCVLPK